MKMAYLLLADSQITLPNCRLLSIPKSFRQSDIPSQNPLTMLGADTFTGSLLAMRRLEDCAPANNLLPPVRQMFNAALTNIGPLLSGMYAADIRGGRSSIAPKRLLRAMLLHIFYSIRSERLLMAQTQYNLLFRWFISLAMDDTASVTTVLSRNRKCLILHDVVTERFNEVPVIANKSEWLTGEHFSVGGTLIQAWAGHESFARKAGSDHHTGNFRKEKRSNDTQASASNCSTAVPALIAATDGY